MDPRRVVGSAKAGMLGHQQLVALCQRIKEWQPLRHPPCAVQEQHLLTTPGAVQLYCDVSDPELSEFSRHLVGSSPKHSLSGPAAKCAACLLPLLIVLVTRVLADI